MGASLSRERIGELSLLRETQDFATWDLDDVKQLYQRFKEQIFGFALVETQFECVMSFKENSNTPVPLPMIFKVLDNDNDGRIDGLEFIGGLALCCRGTFEDKAKFCFELYDFNLNASLSKSEVIMMMQSTICGMICLTGGGESLEPDLEEIEELAEQALRKADSDQSGNISYDEFVEWARGNRDMMAILEQLKNVFEDACEQIDDDDSTSADEASQYASSDLDGECSPLGSDLSDNEDGNRGAHSWLDEEVKRLQQAPSWNTDHHMRIPKEKGCPDANLVLEWVYGYTSSNSRANLRYTSNSSAIVYPAGCTAVVYKKESHTQAFYQGHRHDVVSLAMHPAGILVATGDLGPRPAIHVWSHRSLQCKAFIQGFHRRGVTLVAFSPDGALLASLGLDADHSVALHAWRRGAAAAAAAAAAAGGAGGAAAAAAAGAGAGGRGAGGRLVASGKGHRNKILAMKFAPVSWTEIWLVGQKIIRVLEPQGRSLVGQNLKISPLGRLQIFYCLEFTPAGDALVGTASGELYLFRNRIISQVVQAHGSNEPLLSICPSPETGGVITAGADGLVITWDEGLKQVGQFVDLAESQDHDPEYRVLDTKVISLDISKDGQSILVGTKSSEILEIEVPSLSMESQIIRKIGSAHYGTTAIAALACHPSTAVFATTGGDRTVRLWSLRRRAPAAAARGPLPAGGAGTALAFSPRGGRWLAVGTAGGAVALLDAAAPRTPTATPTLATLASWRHTRAGIREIKFSPDETVLATGSDGGNIFLYRAEKQLQDDLDPDPHHASGGMTGDEGPVVFVRLAVCRGAPGPVRHLDFSRDAQALRANAGGGPGAAATYWDLMGNQLHVTEETETRAWATNTCPASSETTALWEIQRTASETAGPGMKCPTPTCCEGLRQYETLVVGTSSGILQVTRFPFTQNSSVVKSFHGHSAKVTSTRFSHDCSFLLSCGADRCVMQWRFEQEDFDSASEESGDEGDKAATEVNTEILGEIETSIHFHERSELHEAVKQGKTSNELHDLLKEILDGSPSEKERFMAVKPWQSSMVEPETQLKNSNMSTSTDADLSLEWIHGYRCHDVRNNLMYTTSGDILFPAASVGVVYRKAQERQVFQQGAHKDDILSLCLHPDGKTVATGELGLSPKIFVWDSETTAVVSQLSGFHKHGVHLLEFDPKGTLLYSVGLDNAHSLAVYNWQQERLVAWCPTDLRKVYGMCVIAHPTQIVTCGESHIKFWQVRGSNISCQKGVWYSPTKRLHFPKRVLMSAVNVLNSVLTTSADGSLIVWNKHKIGVVYDASAPDALRTNPHACSSGEARRINAVHADSGQGDCWVVTGDHLGGIALWMATISFDHAFSALTEAHKAEPHEEVHVDSWRHVELKPIVAFGLDQLKPVRPLGTGVRALSLRNTMVLIGTDASEIIEADLKQFVLAGAEDDILASATLRGGTKVSSFSSETRRDFKVPGEEGLRSTIRLQGHYKGELWALAIHPVQARFVTGADDCTLRVWEIGKPAQLGHCQVEAKVRAACFSPVAPFHLAVSLISGKVLIYEEDIQQHPLAEFDVSISHVSESGGSEKGGLPWASVLAYSWEGAMLGVGRNDGKLLLFDTPQQSGNGYSLHKDKIIDLYKNQLIAHLDFGVELEQNEGFDWVSKQVVNKLDTNKNIEFEEYRLRVFIQTNSNEGEAAFCDLNGLTRSQGQYKFEKLKAVVWTSWTCVYGWNVQGIWPLKPDGTDFNSVHRCNNFQMVPCLAAGDDYGRVKLFQYPCTQSGSAEKVYYGHSAQITQCRFIAGDSHLVTLGGLDQCIFVWKTDIVEEVRELEAAGATLESEGEEMVYSDQEKELYSHIETLSIFGGGMSKLEEEELGGDGDFRGMVQPWMGSVREPSDWHESNDMGQKPENELKLRHVYGYSTECSRNNLKYGSSNNEIVYNSGSIGIVLDLEKNRQRFNLDHTHDIISLAVHPVDHSVATGALGMVPLIVIWDSNSGNSHLRLQGFHRRGVAHLSYSASGSHLVSVGLDDDHSIAVYDSQNGTLIASGKSNRHKVLALAVRGENHFLTAGVRHCMFWEMASSKGLSSKRGLFGSVFAKDVGDHNEDTTVKATLRGMSRPRCTTVTCAIFLNQDAITGLADGSVSLWKHRNCVMARRAHRGAVSAIDVDREQFNICSGGKDGLVVVWDASLMVLAVFDLVALVPAPPAAAGAGPRRGGSGGGGGGAPRAAAARAVAAAGTAVRALACSGGGGGGARVLVGTAGAELLEVLREEGTARRVGRGHARGRLRALAAHPALQQAATAGDDASVQILDLVTRRTVAARHNLPGSVHSVAYAPSGAGGAHLALGLSHGRVLVLGAQNLDREVASRQVAADAVEVLTYSPDGSLLAVGSADHSIYLLDTDQYGVRAVCRGHSGSVNGVDFSLDSKYLQSTSSARELLFWDAETGARVREAGSVRDVPWATATCPLGWAVQGAAGAPSGGGGRGGGGGGAPTAVARWGGGPGGAARGGVLAAGDARGTVRLFRYPCVQHGAKAKIYWGHSARVTNVRFTPKGRFLLSTGGPDRTVLQFEHTVPGPKRKSANDHTS